MDTEVYPRPDGRGPIEAKRRADNRRRMKKAIRDLTVAAPLKPGLRDQQVCRGESLSAT